MSDAYQVFVIALGAVTLFGGLLGIPGRWRIVTRALEHASVLVTIIASVTAAGLLSVAFLADKFAVAGGALPLLPGSDLPTATGAVLFLVLVGASGLLWGLLGLLIVGRGWWRRWAGGCLAVSAVAVVLLLPASLVLLLSAADAAGASGTT